MAETPQLEKWEQDLCYSTPSFKEHKVNGKIQKFYPVTPAHLFRLRRLGEEAAKAISIITSDRSKDSKTTQQTTRTGETGIESVIQTDAVSLPLAEYRDKKKAESWSGLVTVVMDPDTLNILAGVIMESMRDVFGTADFPLSRPTEERFVSKTSLPTLTQMIVGVAKGNKDVLGPLGDRVLLFLADLEEKYSSKVSDLLDRATSKAAPDSTTGSSSKTPLPSLPDEPAMDTLKSAT